MNFRRLLRWLRGRAVTFTIKVAFLGAIILLLVYQLRQQGYTLAEFGKDLVRVNPYLTLLAAAGVLLNYGLEALKWQLAVRPWFAQIKFRNCLKAVFAGASLGTITPGQLGDYFGRWQFVPRNFRIHAIYATFLDRLAQLFPTLAFSLVGIIALFEHPIFNKIWYILPWISFLLGILILFFISSKLLVVLLLKMATWGFFKRTCLLFAIVARKPKNRFYLIWLSCIRYLVFSSQYCCLLYATGFELRIWEAYALISVVFVIKSFLPSGYLGEPGVREAIALHVMTIGYGVPTGVVIIASFLLFIINRIFPALIGTLFLKTKVT